jgi:hypothetical protein
VRHKECISNHFTKSRFFQGEIKMPKEETKALTFVEERQSGKDEAEPETGNRIRVSW